MLTLKIPYICQNEKFQDTLLELRTVQSSFVRSAYQLFRSGLKQYDVQKDTDLHSKFLLSSWLKQSALYEAKAIQERFKDQKIIFGGKKNFYDRLNGKISKEKYKNLRLNKLYSIGESSKNGNRLFTLNINENQIIFKPAKGIKYVLNLCNLRANWKNKLLKLQERTDLKKIPYTVKLDDKFIYLTFEEPKLIKTKRINGRFIGIDMNPSNIGLSIIQQKDDQIKILYTREWSLDKIIKEIKSLRLPSSDPKVKHLNEKLRHETIEISKEIEGIANGWNCKGIFIEDLKFKVGNSEFGRSFNRLTKNLWKRKLFVENLRKRSKINNLDFYEVMPQYSSQIGNLMYDYTDPVNASIEIAKRGAQVIFEKIKKNRKFYPDFTLSLLKDQWKEHFKRCKSWKEVFSEIKNSGLKYRVSDVNAAVFSFKCTKSKIFYYCF